MQCYLLNIHTPSSSNNFLKIPSTSRKIPHWDIWQNVALSLIRRQVTSTFFILSINVKNQPLNYADSCYFRDWWFVLTTLRHLPSRLWLVQSQPFPFWLLLAGLFAPEFQKLKAILKYFTLYFGGHVLPMPLAALSIYSKSCNKESQSLHCRRYNAAGTTGSSGSSLLVIPSDLYLTQSATEKIPNSVLPSPQRAVALFIFCYFLSARLSTSLGFQIPQLATDLNISCLKQLLNHYLSSSPIHSLKYKHLQNLKRPEVAHPKPSWRILWIAWTYPFRLSYFKWLTLPNRRAFVLNFPSRLHF